MLAIARSFNSSGIRSMWRDTRTYPQSGCFSGYYRCAFSTIGKVMAEILLESSRVWRGFAWLAVNVLATYKAEGYPNRLDIAEFQILEMQSRCPPNAYLCSGISRKSTDL